MPLIPFERMPGDARLWVFAATEMLMPEQARRLRRETDEFLAGWSAHRVPLATSRELRHEQFLFVAADEATAGASGCSIDALVRFMRELEGRLDVRLTDNAPVWFRDAAGIIRCTNRPHFQEMADRGNVSLETIVFDNTIQSVAALREGRWEVPARMSWHGGAFFSQSIHAR